MQYDPIKRSLGKVFNRRPWLRKLFYRLLDLLLLRSWHIRKNLKQWALQAPENAAILDAGMGFGQYSYFLSRMKPGYTVKGVDVKEEQIEDCNGFFSQIGRKNASFAYADLTAYAEPATYDLVLSVDVMEHILEDVKVFENFHTSLKPGGMVLISTPSDQGGSDVHDHDEESFIEEHVRDGYNISEIQEKLKKAGFSRTEAHYQYGKPGQVSWRLSMKYPILMLGKSKLFFILLPFYYLVTFPFCLLLNQLDVTGNHKSGTGLVVKAWK
jgi:2-polyprenyl-3-methyl-5-hydroxy-6-metoxy-1,4-benzoquinol methylase